MNGNLQLIHAADIKCCHCNKYISSDLRDLLEHCRLCPAMTRTDLLKHKYVCYACSYATYYNGNMKKHLRIHLGDRPFMCTLCNYSATRNTHLKLHMKTHFKNDLKYLIWQWLIHDPEDIPFYRGVFFSTTSNNLLEFCLFWFKILSVGLS